LLCLLLGPQRFASVSRASFVASRSCPTRSALIGPSTRRLSFCCDCSAQPWPTAGLRFGVRFNSSAGSLSSQARRSAARISVRRPLFRAVNSPELSCLVERRLAGGSGLCGLCNRIGQQIGHRSGLSPPLPTTFPWSSLTLLRAIGKELAEIGNVHRPLP
jgi:hypothetical protein